MSKDTDKIIRIWAYSEVPLPVKQLSEKKAEWVILIPPSLACAEIQALFLRPESGGHSVIRNELTDGSVLFLVGDAQGQED
jgi:hypothetical protein